MWRAKSNGKMRKQKKSEKNVPQFFKIHAASYCNREDGIEISSLSHSCEKELALSAIENDGRRL